MEDTLTHEGIYSNATLPLQLPYLLSDKDTLKNNHIAYINPFRYRSYYYDMETNLYYLTTRYYDPETGRFINADDISIIDTTKDYIGGLNLYTYCLNNPINTADDDGTMPNWLKWLVGGIAFVASIVLTALTGGALAPLFISMGVSIVAGGLIQGTINAVSGGSFWKGFADGMADGALWGGVFSLGSAALRTIKLFKNGIVVGENMTRVNSYAKQIGAVTYKGMPGFKLINRINNNSANALGMAHNKAWLNRMMKWGVKTTDIGLNMGQIVRGKSFAMEQTLIRGYWNRVINIFKAMF